MNKERKIYGEMRMRNGDRIKKSVALLVILLLGSLGAVGQDLEPIAVEDMPNVNLADASRFVSDPAGLMSPQARRAVDMQLMALRDSIGVEMAVAIVPDLGDESIEDFSQELFERWGLGDKKLENGVLLVVSPGSRKARIHTGYGAEGVLYDGLCSEVIRKEIAPRMLEGNLDGAVMAATERLVRVMLEPANAAELRSDPNARREAEAAKFRKMLYDLIFYLGITVFLIEAGIFIRQLYISRRFKGRRYERACMYRSSLTLYLIMGLLSWGAGLIFFIWAWVLYRYARTKPLKCASCGHKMRRLPENEDNELLSDSQDFEERLRTVDYDVWECPQCGAVERFRYKYPQKKYTECPACHTVAMYHVGDVVTRAATTRNVGAGEKVYECKYCHHQNRIPYVIPKKVDEAAAAVAAGAILGSMGRGGNSSGGGFGGGGFGGGSSGGGGASGGW